MRPAILAVAVLLAACGGGAGDPEGAEQAETAETAETGTMLHDWVDCMRDEGIDLPDPTRDDRGDLVVTGDGFDIRPPTGGEATARFGDHTDAEVRAAMDACEEPPILEPGVAGEATRAAHDARRQAFEDCMADHGIDRLPDDVPDGASPGAGGPDPATLDAIEACRAEEGEEAPDDG